MDMDYLHAIVDLLVDMADCIEELGRIHTPGPSNTR